MSETEAKPKIKFALISQPPPDKGERSPFLELASKYGLKLDFKPFIQVQGINARDFRREKINLKEVNHVVFHSRNSIDHYFRMCEEMRVEIDLETRYYCISESIAMYLQKYTPIRRRKIFFGRGQLEELLPFMLKQKESSFLMPCSDVFQDIFLEKAANLALNITRAVMFRTVSSDLSHVNLSQYDLICFFSPLGIKSLFENYPNFQQGNTRIAAFGNQTHGALLEKNLKLDIPAPTHEFPSMVMAVEAYLKKVNR